MLKTAKNMSGLPWIAAMAFFMQALDATILNTALPDIAKSLHHSPLAMQSAVVSYTLTVALLIPVSGWFADRFGTRRVFILAVTLFSSGSLLCALSPTLDFLVASRVIQGIGGAMMMPVARLALIRAYPRSELLPILNFVTIPGLVGPILGPLLGGILVTYTTWHWIFIINIPIGVLGIFYALKHMPDFKMPKRKFDTFGFILFGFGLVMLSVSLDLFSDKSLPSYIPIAIVLTGFLFLLFYILYARRVKHAIIPLNLFKTRTFSIGISGNLATRLGTGSIPFLMPLMLQVGFGYEAVVAGMMMAPLAIGSITAKSGVTKILTHFGYRKTLFVITIIIGLMITQFSLQSPNMSIYLLVIPLFILGMAMSIQFTAMNTICLADLTDNNASAGNSMLAVTQQLSISFGIAVSAAILSYYDGQPSGNTVDNFHYTFITVGVITLASAFVFLLLNKTDGDNLIKSKIKTPVD
ncbi:MULTISPECIES: multidrug transporter subunit MdtD [Providencia]|uniref:Major facilitator superfamily permease n=1 Tax=Providencia heimbachae ATCC 35613 TaxID=1354272 RepID=A0A1B7JUJ4_9GAMM|nr:MULTISPECIES: multidrug transporter subunit MdtD [Providencia]MBP6121719.1 multidrug transporter subunit MdtD [Providencia sp.]MDD9339152.1 multidrug transporter subunit MdtD [Providencia heimbachae]NIH20805.1 multidrug transporter subunit MdtD [Providencia heimbachae]OAT51580.1 major facilitator superfamily permease [Providencia heimbachae ATCC 35613]QCJ68461.1 MFS transporter [Providencia heimbachae]